MENKSLRDFKRERRLIEKRGEDTFVLDLIIESMEILEDTSATGGPGGSVASSAVGFGGGGVAYSNASSGGMGAIVSAQPSVHAGSTMEPAFSAGGGSIGSGDVSVPYNMGGKKVFQKMKVDNRKGTSKRRHNKMLAGLKRTLGKKMDYTNKPEKTMDFEKFFKSQLKNGKP